MWMKDKRKMVIWGGAALGLVLIVATVLFFVQRRKPLSLNGAVMVLDTDVRKQLPIADVDVTAENALGRSTAKSDSSGYFTIKLLVGIRNGQTVTLHFRHPDYQPLDLQESASNKLYIAHLTALSRTAKVPANQP